MTIAFWAYRDFIEPHYVFTLTESPKKQGNEVEILSDSQFFRVWCVSDFFSSLLLLLYLNTLFCSLCVSVCVQRGNAASWRPSPQRGWRPAAQHQPQWRPQRVGSVRSGSPVPDRVWCHYYGWETTHTHIYTHTHTHIHIHTLTLTHTRLRHKSKLGAEVSGLKCQLN